MVWSIVLQETPSSSPSLTLWPELVGLLRSRDLNKSLMLNIMGFTGLRLVFNVLYSGYLPLMRTSPSTEKPERLALTNGLASPSPHLLAKFPTTSPSMLASLCGCWFGRDLPWVGWTVRIGNSQWRTIEAKEWPHLMSHKPPKSPSFQRGGGGCLLYHHPWAIHGTAC